MKTRVIKKFVSVLITCIFLMSMIMPNNVNAMLGSINASPKKNYNTELKYKNYLALGDSIAEGYGLDIINNTTIDKRYADIIKDTYNISTYNNLAVTGMKTVEFVEYIKQHEEQIKNADLITISIGSNEILHKFIDVGLETFGASDESNFATFAAIKLLQKAVEIAYTSNSPEEALKDFNTYTQAAFKILDEFINKFGAEDTFNEVVNQYVTNWDASMKYIRKINPKAQIVVTEFYNPYNNYIGLSGDEEIAKTINSYLERIKTLGKDYISKFNAELKKLSSKYNYDIAEIYNECNKGGYLNVSIDLSSFDVNDIIAKSTEALKNYNLNDLINYYKTLDVSMVNVDPHPNVEGHKLIAEKIKEKLNKPLAVASVFGNGSIAIICGIVVAAIIAGSIVVYMRKKNLQ